MSYKCEILADSLSPQGNRLTTFKVTYPRIIHAEMCRHRMLSRNTASSRAIPFEKMVKDVQENPFVPIAWQKDHKGMQGTEYVVEPYEIENRRHAWITSSYEATKHAQWLNNLNVTKQLCNRLLEPFVWTTELVSGTEWENFFELRCPKYKNNITGEYFKSKKDFYKWIENSDRDYDSTIDELIPDGFEYINDSQAEIHIQKIAEMMWDAYNESKPKTLQAGQWHIPYGDNISNDVSLYSSDIKEQARLWGKDLIEERLKIATARAARISYTTLGDNPKIDYEADIKLHDRLLESKHLSCFEHCARVMSNEEYYSFIKGRVPTQRDEYGILNYEYYTYSNGKTNRNGEFWMGFDGMNPKNGNRYGWCNNFQGFIPYRYLIENKND